MGEEINTSDLYLNSIPLYMDIFLCSSFFQKLQSAHACQWFCLCVLIVSLTGLKMWRSDEPQEARKQGVLAFNVKGRVGPQEESVEGSASQLGLILLPKEAMVGQGGHLIIFRDIFGDHSLARRGIWLCHWHLVGRGQVLLNILQGTGQPPTKVTC